MTFAPCREMRFICLGGKRVSGMLLFCLGEIGRKDAFMLGCGARSEANFLGRGLLFKQADPGIGGRGCSIDQRLG